MGGVAWPAWAAALGSVAAAVLALMFLRSPPRRLMVRNYAGRAVPAVLGPAFVAAVAVGTVAVAVLPSGLDLGRTGIGALVAMAVVGAAGLADDLAGAGPRGLRAHVASLLRGRPTTGILKLAAGVGAGVGLAVLLGGGAARIVAVAVLLAACANVWNALDVVPGRAIKWGTVALVLLLPATWTDPAGLVVGAALGGAVGLLPFDLVERGMLGDAGSNPLGLAVGFGLAAGLPTPAVVVAAGVALVLQGVAETVTISRLVEAVPALRWLDSLGRRGNGTDRRP
jgi:hypothetical protein